MGILAEFPDLTQVLDVQIDVSARFSTVDTPLARPENLTRSLTTGIGNLRMVIPDNPADLGQPIQGAIASLSNLLESPDIPELQAFQTGFTQAQALLAPFQEQVLSGDFRDFRSFMRARVGDPEQIVTNLLAKFNTLLPLEAFQTFQTFITTLRQFETSIPTDPDGIADFLAQAFLGVPVNLLAQPLGVVNNFYSRIDQLVLPASLNAFRRQVEDTHAQLVNATHLVRNLDPTSPTHYDTLQVALRTVQTELAAIAPLVNGLTTDFQSRLTALDPASLFTQLQTALVSVPQVQVAGADAFINTVLEPLRQLNQQLDQITPQQLVEQIDQFNNALRSLIAEQGFEQIHTTLMKPFQDLGEAIAGLHLERLHDGLIAAFEKIRSSVTEVANSIQKVGDSLKQIPEKLNQGLAALTQASDQVGGAINGAITQVNNGLTAIPLESFKQQILSVIQKIKDLLNRVQPQLQTAIGQINDLREQIEHIDLREAAQPAFDLMKSVQEELAKIKLSALGELEASAFRVSVSVLLDIDLSPARTSLNGILTQIDPSPLLDGIEQGYQGLLGKLAQYSPSALLQPLEQPFNEMKDTLNRLDPSQLLKPLIDELQSFRQDMVGLNLEQAIVPLLSPLDDARKALDAIAPTRLLAPVVQAFESVTGLLDKLNIQPLVDELQGLFPGWIDQAIAALQASSDSMRNLEWLKPYLDQLEGDDNSLTALPGLVLKPLEMLFNQIMALLDRLPEAQLLSAFQRLQSQLVDGLEAIDPTRLTGQLWERLQAALTPFDVANQFSVVFSLYDAYSDLVLALDSIDPVQVSAEMQGNHAVTVDLVVAVNPEGAIAPLRPNLQTLNQSLLSMQSNFDPSGLVPSVAPLLEKITNLIPDFLRQLPSISDLKAQLQLFNPAPLASQVNQEFSQMLTKLNQFGSTLSTELGKLIDTLKTGGADTFLPSIVQDLFEYLYEPLRNNQPIINALQRMHPSAILTHLLESLRTSTSKFLPGIVQGAFEQIYAPIRAQINTLNPAPIIAQLESIIYQPIRTALQNLDPRSILADLNLSETLAQLGTTLEGIIHSLSQLKSAIANRWQQILGIIDTVNPKNLATILDDAFVDIQNILTTVDMGGILDALKRAIARIHSDLDKMLDEAEQALEAMLSAVPQ